MANEFQTCFGLFLERKQHVESVARQTKTNTSMKTFKRVYQLCNWHVSNVKLPSCVPFPSCSNVASLVNSNKSMGLKFSRQRLEQIAPVCCWTLEVFIRVGTTISTTVEMHIIFNCFPFLNQWLDFANCTCSLFTPKTLAQNPHENCQLKSKIGDAARRLQC